MQKGSIRISGKWWYLKVRENVLKNGQTARDIMYHKLAPVEQYRPSSNGEPPSGLGADGRPVRKVTLKAYKRDYVVIKDLIPDIQLRSIRTPDINKLFKAL